MRLLSVSEMQGVEAAADAAGQTYAAMMALAGEGVARAVAGRESLAGRRVLVLVGPGNNGGDGLVAARHLHEAGANVTAYLAKTRAPKEDGVFEAAEAAGVAIVDVADDGDGASLRDLAARADVIVDALLGTGATPPLRGSIATILETVNQSLSRPEPYPLMPVRSVPEPRAHHPLVVAVDGPSGLDFDTGEVDPMTLSADLTVTFAAPKWGHVRLPGAARIGELVIADIGIPDGVEIPSGPELATPDLIRSWLPERPMGSHKGTFGKAMIIAGSANYTGAAILSSTAAVRVGAGLVTLALPNPLHAAVVSAIPEVTYVLLPHAMGVVDEYAVPVVLENVEGYDALLVGPGMGNTDESREFLRSLLRPRSGKRSTGFLHPEAGSDPEALRSLPPLVVDADGLNILSETENWPALLPEGTVLTPHPGEMSRLTGLSIGEIQANRLEIAQRWADTWHQVVVLKGAFTIVAGPARQPVVLPFANPGLSSAGTGDVLAGTIVGLRAQGVGAFEAAVAGAFLHGLAGDIATERLGSAGTAAGDVAQALAEAGRRLA